MMENSISKTLGQCSVESLQYRAAGGGGGKIDCRGTYRDSSLRSQ